MKNSDNPRGFFNWQGNALKYNYIGNYLVVAFIFLALVLAIIFKKQLRNYFLAKSTNRVLIFSNLNSFLQFVGVIMIFIWTFRIGILTTYNYPYHFEHIGLHICRIHFILISFFLTFKRKEYLKYIFYISVLSAIIGIAFGSTSADLTKQDSIFVENGFTFYNAGIDTHYYWDYHITHLLTGILPIIICFGITKKITTIEFYRVMLNYVIVTILIFSINYFSDFATNRGWRSNYWYLGRDRNNKYKSFLGWITSWPQNLPSILAFGISFLYISHLGFISIDGNFKNHIKAFLESHNKQNFKHFFRLSTSKR